MGSSRFMGGVLNLERGAIAELVRRPSLWIEAVRAYWASRSLTSTAYLRWRHATAYGDEVTTMSAHDLVNYLSWRREMRKLRNGSG